MAETAPSSTAPGVAVFNPEGQLVVIPELNQAALMNGYRAATPEDVHDFQQDQKYGGFGQGLAAAAEGAASALTFGISPRLEVESGLTTPEAIAGRQEVHPIAHGAGTILGVAAPLVASLGAAAPETAAAAAAATEGAGGARLAAALRGAAEYTAPGLIAKAGRAAAQGLVEAAPESIGVAGGFLEGPLQAGVGAGSQLAARLLPTVASGAVEGALYAGEDVNEKTLLGDPQMTWEKAASELGLGALFGGALAGGTEAAAKGLGYALNKVTQGLESIGKRIATGDPEMVNLALKAQHEVSAFEDMVPGVTDSLMTSNPETFSWMLKNAEKIAEYNKEFPGLADIFSRQSVEANEKILRDFPLRFRDQLDRDAAGMAQNEILNDAYRATESALFDANRTVRPAEVEALAGKVDPLAANAEAGRVRDLITEKIRLLQQKPATYGTQVPGKLIEIMTDLDKAAGQGPEGVFKALNAAKKQLQAASKFEITTPVEQRAAISEIKSLGRDIRKSLENVDVWGEAGMRQAAYNKAEHIYMKAKSDLEQDLMFKRKSTQKFEGKASKVNTWLNLPAGNRGETKSATFYKYIGAAREMANQMEASGAEGAAALRAQLDGIEQATKDIQQRATVSYLIKGGQGHSIISSGAPVPMEQQLALAAAKRIPGGVGQIVGAIHGTLSKVRDPGALVNVLSLVNRAAEKATRALNEGVSGIFGHARSAAVGGAADRASNITSGSFPGVSSNLHDYGGNLDRFAEDVHKQTEILAAYAPNTAASAHDFAGRVVQYLRSKLPQGGQRFALDPAFEPSATELATFNRYYEIAERGPVAMLHHLADGTLMPEHLEASQVLYPKLHEDVKLRVMDALTERLTAKEQVPYATRLQISRLLGQPLERSMTPAAIFSAQLTYGAGAGPQEPMPAGPPPGKLARNVNTDFGQRLATSTQGVTQRMERGA